jgi:hypothetical protein
LNSPAIERAANPDRRCYAIAAGLTAACAIIIACFQLASAQVENQVPLESVVLEDALAAAAKLVESVSSKQGEVPRLSNPQIAYMFSVAFSPKVATNRAPNAENIEAIAELQGYSSRLVKSYLLTGTEEGTESVGDVAETNRQIGTNMLEYLDEIAFAYDFSLLAGAQIAEFAAGSGNGGINSGLLAPIVRTQTRILASVLASATDPAIAVSWRSERLTVMTATAADFAKLLAGSNAQAIADRALAAARTEQNEEISSALKKFALLILQ